MLPTKFWFIWSKSFRREHFLEINQAETRIACGGHACLRIATRWAIFIEVLPRMLPMKFRLIRQRGFRGEDFLEINQSEAKIACGGHVCFYGSQLDEQFLYRWVRGLSKDASYQIRFTWQRGFRGEDVFRNQPIRTKNDLWWPCLFPDRN